MLILLQFLFPVLACLLSLIVHNQEQTHQKLARTASVLSLAISIVAILIFSSGSDNSLLSFDLPLLESIGASLALEFNGISLMFSLLTSIAFCFAFFLPVPATVEKRSSTYFALLHLCQFALYGVFTSNDALFFYLFWELTLIPIYFLSSFFGGARRIEITFSFFIYTFIASILLLVGFIYVYTYSASGSFAYNDFINTTLQDSPYASLVFWMIFIAFAVKTPIFPFHGWQASLYTTAPLPLTLVLGSVVAKMGLFAVVHWMIPIFQFMIPDVSPVIIILSLVGVVYGALIASRQKDIKSVFAYSSLSHLSLMMLSLFVSSQSSLDGALLQMFAHGLVNVGLWFVLFYVEKAYGNTMLETATGLTYKNSFIAFALLIFSFANIGLPLTANFVGEWMMLSGILQSPHLLFSQSIWFVAVAGLGVIFSAVYTLRYLKTVVYGAKVDDQKIHIPKREVLMLSLLVALVILLGVYPSALLDTLNWDVQSIMETIQNITIEG